MSFSVPPRSWSPVLSISTRREETDTLRAQIDAACTQQKATMKLSAKSKMHRIPTFPDRAAHDDPKTPLYRHMTIDSWSDAGTLQSPVRCSRSLGDAIKGELSSAKQIIKSTSKKQLRRLRTRASRSSAAKHTQHNSNHDTTNDLRGIAELSSDPPMPQLEDTQRYVSAPLPSLYAPTCNETVPDAIETPGGGFYATDLSSKSYSCDGCRQNLTGKDFYDFCQGCHSTERVLCMTCASNGGCWRHRQDSIAAVVPPSLCASPAPSYDHDFGLRQDRKDDILGINQAPCLRLRSGLPPVDLDIVIEETSEDFQSPGGNLPSKVPSVRRTVDEKPAMVAQLQHDLMNEVIDLLRKQETSTSLKTPFSSQEAVLRDQQAALREQQISLREEALLLKEREHLARERDATFIRNLQTFAIESLSRGQHIGAQFQASKGNSDGARSPTSPTRSRPDASHSSDMSLELASHRITPKKALSDLTANAEALIGRISDESKYIQTYTEKRKKTEAPAKNDAAMTTTSNTLAPPTKVTSRSQSSERNNFDADEDDEFAPAKRRKRTPPRDEIPRRSFACPYCKHDPERYTIRNNSEMKYRNCGSHFLPSIPRVKQHLQRVHWRPDNHCQRCYKVFNSPAELMEHSRQRESCERQECPFREKMDLEQRRQVHVKRPNTPPETLWYDIFKILFPESSLPDSPYADEYNLPTPASAATSTADSDETSQMLQSAFNEGLNRYVDQFDQTHRDLLNRVLEDAMSTVFNGTPVTPSRSPMVKPSRTPSIVISPVTPSPMSRRNLAVPESSSPGETSSRRQAGKPVAQRMKTSVVPQLLRPERQYLAPALDVNVASCATRTSGSNSYQNAACMMHPSLATADSSSLPSPSRFATNNIDANSTEHVQLANATMPAASYASHMETPPASLDFLTDAYDNEYFDGSHVIDAGFDWLSQPMIPSYVLQDTGYDDESNSYEQGDDQYAMQGTLLMTSMHKAGDLAYSPVDSGYGSINSMHPRSRVSLLSTKIEADESSASLDTGISLQRYCPQEEPQQPNQSYYPDAIGRAM